MFNKIIKFSLAIAFLANAAIGQTNYNNVVNSANSLLGNGLSNDKIVAGLKEALNIGAKKSSERASVLDGFYKNPLIKIPFPPEVKQMESTLKQIGMQKQVDSFVKTMNRAAEDAAKKAGPIFINAVTRMSIGDGLKILQGGNNAATEFLKSSTTQSLKNEFKPVVQNSLKKVNITKYWSALAKNYNKLPMVKKMSPDLDEYVTTRAIDGLFKLVAEEELKIRQNPAAQVTGILQDVFGKR